MYEMYKKAQNRSSERVTWLTVQELAAEEDAKSVKKLTDIILSQERTAIKLPIIRIATGKEKTVAGLTIKKDEVVICDIVSSPNASKFKLTIDRAQQMPSSSRKQSKTAEPPKTQNT